MQDHDQHTKLNRSKGLKWAVLLAAGLGERLLPYTSHTPKPLLMAGNQPVLNYVFSSLKETDIRNIILVTNHHENQIISYTKERFGKSFNLRFCHQPLLNGTAGALRCAAEVIKKETPDDFLISATDYQMPSRYLKAFIKFHSNGSHDLSVGLRKIMRSRVKESNITTIDQNNKIVSISEKPQTRLHHEFYTASYLLYIVPRQIIDYLNRLQPSKRGEYELPELINLMIKEKFHAQGYFHDQFPAWEETYSFKSSIS